MSRLPAARQHLDASADVARELGRGALWLTYALMYAAHAAIEQADVRRARSLLRESLERHAIAKLLPPLEP